MKKTVALCGSDSNLTIFRLELEREDADLKDVVRKASLDYCKTEEGRKLFLEKGRFTYGDFFTRVPAGYGLRKVETFPSDLVAHDSECVLSGSDAIFLMQDSGETERKWSVCEVAAKFGILWGIAQTLESRDSLSRYGKDVDILMAWAGEFVSSGRDDLPGFFMEKLEDRRDGRQE